MLGGEGEHVEVHRFGHWGPGWIEIILVDPGHYHTLWTAGEIVCSLADYPVLDEEDWSEREFEAAGETWEQCFNDKERIEYLRSNGCQQVEFSELRATIRGESLAAVSCYSELVSY